MDYKIITLCGSTRFKEEFLREQKRLTLEGNIVLSVGCFGHSGDDEAFTTKTKIMLDDMHKRKIDMASSIFVVNPGGYIGASTQSEITYAAQHMKRIQYMEPGELKLYVITLTELDERIWIAAFTVAEAIGEYLQTTCEDEIEPHTIVEVPKIDWANHTITNPEYDEEDPEDWEKMTFEEYMSGIGTSQWIASTLYD